MIDSTAKLKPYVQVPKSFMISSISAPTYGAQTCFLIGDDTEVDLMVLRGISKIVLLKRALNTDFLGCRTYIGYKAVFYVCLLSNSKKCCPPR